jgi:LysR family transcriptional regulator, hypochlorite-specific transcription factor HypT
MEIKWVEDFLSLADTRSFSRAAEERNVSQPTFSRRIKALEDWLGVELVDRSAHGASLTAAGRVFRGFGADMLRRTYDMRTMLRGQAPVAGDAVQFAVAHTLSLTYFPRWLKLLKDEFGPILARVVAVNVHEGATALVEGTSDLLIAYHHAQLPILLDPNRFPYMPLGVDRILPFSTTDNNGRAMFRLPGRPDRPLPFLAYASGAYLAHVVEIILLSAREPCSLERRFETHMSEALKAMVVEGHGLGWLPESCVGREIADRRLVCAGSAAWSTQLEVRIYRAADNDKPAVEKFWSFLLQQQSNHPA